MTFYKTKKEILHKGFFKDSIEKIDIKTSNLINEELVRQQSHIELIASENIVSKAVLQALGSVFTNKTVEGYPGKRYFSGVKISDNLETIAIERAKKLFNVKYVNVQPHSGSQANHGVYASLLKPGQKILAMDLNAGGHLSHGARPNFSSKVYQTAYYSLDEGTSLLDYDMLDKTAYHEKPNLIIAGGSSYSRIIDFEKISKIAKKYNSYLLADMAHFSGLVVTGFYPNPANFADVCTTTTYKSLRGPRGGIILSNSEEIAKKINAAIFPGTQGTPMLNTIAAKAICFHECLKPEFKNYNEAVLNNAATLAEVLIKNNLDIVSGGTDTNLLVVDLRGLGLKGDNAAELLDNVGLTCNKNSVLNDPEGPTITSGIRLSSSAGTTRGLGENEFKLIGEIICKVLIEASKNNLSDKTITDCKNKVRMICDKFPIY